MIKLLTILAVCLIIYQVQMTGIGGVMNYDETKNFVKKCNKGPQTFKPEETKYFNCSVTSETIGGDLYCTKEPCDEDSDCNWQVLPGGKIDLNFGHFYNLYPCRSCPTVDCNGKYAYPNDNECGYGGEFKALDYGRSWYCVNTFCKGEMKERKDKKGYYECVDNKCWGTGKLDENYICQDPTCTAAGGSMQWKNESSKWECVNYKCGYNIDGRMAQKSEGWACESLSCPGEMVEKSDGKYGTYYSCVDPNCKGMIKFTEDKKNNYYYCDYTNPWYYLMGGIVIAGVAVYIVQKKKQQRLEQNLINKHRENSYSDNYQALQNFTVQ